MHQDAEDFEMPEPARVSAAAEVLRMLGDRTRLTILLALRQGETSVACLGELAGASPTSVSQHLSKLRLSGVVTRHRVGGTVTYQLADHHLDGVVVAVLAHAGHAVPAGEPARRG